MLFKLLALAVVVAFVFALTWMPPIGHAAPLAQIDVATLFQQRCGPCHGKNAEGTTMAPALTRLGNSSDEQLRQIISEGKTGTNMLAWKTTLSADEISALIPYIRALDSAASQPPAPTAAVVPNPVPQPKLAVALEITPSTAGVVIVRATVRDDKGQPAYDVPVVYHLVTALGGRLEVGSIKTDTLGSALIEYTAGEGRYITLEATAGQGAQAAMTSATATTPGGVEWSPAPLISSSPPIAEIALLVVVLGGVWLTYAFIGRQLIGILRDG
jgi:cytochrome c553